VSPPTAELRGSGIEGRNAPKSEADQIEAPKATATPTAHLPWTLRPERASTAPITMETASRPGSITSPNCMIGRTATKIGVRTQ